MTATMARLVLAMLLLPAAGAVFLLSFFALARPSGPPRILQIVIVWLVIYAFVAVYWVLLWRSLVRWTAARVVRTAVVSGLALLVGTAAGFLFTALAPWAPGQIVVLVAGGGPRPAAAGLDISALAGDGLMVLSSLAVALYYVLSVELIARYSVVTVAALTSIAGTAVLTPVAAWELGHAPAHLSAVGIGAVVYLAVPVTVVGIQIWLRALERLPVSVAAVLQYLQPLVGVAASAALFGDRLGIWFAAGTGLVLLGIAWSTTSRPRDPGKDRPGPRACRLLS